MNSIKIITAGFMAFAFCIQSHSIVKKVNAEESISAIDSVLNYDNINTKDSVQKEQNGIYYKINNNSYVTITGCSDELTELIIPDFIEHLPVLQIEHNAFEGKNSIETVSIPDLIRIMYNDSFTGTKFEKYADGWLFGFDPEHILLYEYQWNIKDDVKGIAVNAFAERRGASHIIFPDSLKYICAGAFRDASNVSSITLPESVEYIGVTTFYECISLKTIKILNPRCRIDMGAKQTTFYPNTKIEGYNSSTAQKFCYENPKKFISIGDAPEKFRIENYYRFNIISNTLLNLKSETDVESDNVSIFDAIRSKREMIYENLAYNIH